MVTGPGLRWRHRPKMGHSKKKQGTEGEVMKPKNGRASHLGNALCAVLSNRRLIGGTRRPSQPPVAEAPGPPLDAAKRVVGAFKRADGDGAPH
jgi:hypothetical protein